MIGLTLEIQQSPSELTINRKFNRNGEQRQVSQSFTLDGEENSNRDATGSGELLSKSKMHKNSIVIEGTRRLSMGGRSVEAHFKDEYSLSKDRRTLTVKSGLQTPRGMTEIKQTFSRQGEN